MRHRRDRLAVPRLFPTRVFDVGQIFIADIVGLSREEMRVIGVEDLKTYRFWYRDESKRIRIYGTPEPRPDEPEYYRLVDDLATDLADVLKKASAPAPLLAARSVNPQPGAIRELPSSDVNGPQGLCKRILFGEVTDDLEPSRQQVRRYLEQAGHSVHLCQSYGKTVEEFQREFRNHMLQSSLFVQLLSHVASRPLSQLPEGYAVWQHRCAQDSKVQIVQWRNPAILPTSVDDPAQRDLLLQDTVVAVSFDTFKRLLLEAIREQSIVRPPSQSAPFVFVNAEKSDLHIANQIKDYVGKYTAVFLPVQGGKPEEIRLNTEANIVDCDGLLVVYGDGSAAWVQQQLRLYNKLAPHRERPIKLLAVIEAPPDSKPDINALIPGMRILNCRSGIDEATLSSIAGHFSHEPRQ